MFLDFKIFMVSLKKYSGIRSRSTENMVEVAAAGGRGESWAGNRSRLSATAVCSHLRGLQKLPQSVEDFGLVSLWVVRNWENYNAILHLQLRSGAELSQKIRSSSRISPQKLLLDCLHATDAPREKHQHILISLLTSWRYTADGKHAEKKSSM